MAQTPEVRALLKAFHERYPGATGSAAGALVDEAGRNSYVILADAVIGEDESPAFLDLGCGDGALLEYIAKLRPHASLSGIDLVESEVERACARVPQAHLVTGDVTEELPFGNRNFDVVTAHLVLMLLGPLDSVLAHVARVLRPGGRFGFVVDDLANTPSSYEHLMRCGMEGAGTLRPGTRFNAASDPRLYNESALRELLNAHGMRTERLQRFRLHAPLSPESAWERMCKAYPIGSLDDAGQERARAAIVGEVQQERMTEIMVPLRLCVAERVAA
jgi:SAM-dependent methyltransferase